MDKRFVRVIRSTIVFVSVLFLVTGAHGDPKDLKVVYADWFPFIYSENGKTHGFEMEIFDAVAGRMGIRATYAGYPWRRCLRLLETGEADALVSMMKTPGRDRYTDYPAEHISLSRAVFFTKADSPIRYDGNLEALKGLNIGLINGFSYGEALDRADFLKKNYAMNTKALIKKLLAGRNQVAAENRTVVSGHIRKMGIADRIRFLDPAITTEKLYVGFSTKNALRNLVGPFSEALSAFKQSESYRTILHKYGVAASQQEN